jgi:hypothetical protein
MQRRVDSWKYTDVSEVHTTSIIRVMNVGLLQQDYTPLDPGNLSSYSPPLEREISMKQSPP